MDIPVPLLLQYTQSCHALIQITVFATQRAGCEKGTDWSTCSCNRCKPAVSHHWCHMEARMGAHLALLLLMLKSQPLSLLPPLLSFLLSPGSFLRSFTCLPGSLCCLTSLVAANAAIVILVRIQSRSLNRYTMACIACVCTMSCPQACFFLCQPQLSTQSSTWELEGAVDVHVCASGRQKSFTCWASRCFCFCSSASLRACSSWWRFSLRASSCLPSSIMSTQRVSLAADCQRLRLLHIKLS